MRNWNSLFGLITLTLALSATARAEELVGPGEVVTQADFEKERAEFSKGLRTLTDGDLVRLQTKVGLRSFGKCTIGVNSTRFGMGVLQSIPVVNGFVLLSGAEDRWAGSSPVGFRIFEGIVGGGVATALYELGGWIYVGFGKITGNGSSGDVQAMKDEMADAPAGVYAASGDTGNRVEKSLGCFNTKEAHRLTNNELERRQRLSNAIADLRDVKASRDDVKKSNEIVNNMTGEDAVRILKTEGTLSDLGVASAIRGY